MSNQIADRKQKMQDAAARASKRHEAVLADRRDRTKALIGKAAASGGEIFHPTDISRALDERE